MEKTLEETITYADMKRAAYKWLKAVDGFQPNLDALRDIYMCAVSDYLTAKTEAVCKGGKKS